MLNISAIINKYKNEKGLIPEQPTPVDTTSTAQPHELSLVPHSLYLAATELSRMLYTDEARLQRPETAPSLHALSKKMCDSLIGDNDELLQSVFIDYPADETFLFKHAANVCILSLAIGNTMGLSHNLLVTLGAAALVHDCGMMRFKNLLFKPDIFNSQERSTIQQHTREGVEMLAKSKGSLDVSFMETISQEHERMDGSGYPNQLLAPAICEGAKILGLADTYEALVHKRVYRDKHTPLDAIRIILQNKDSTDKRALKGLLDKVGVFPRGTIVRLNTKEIGIVIETNPHTPFSPLVSIIYDANAKELVPPKQVNLAENSIFVVEECIKA